MKVKAHGPWALIEIIPPEEATKGGIIIPATSNERKLGYVVAKVLSLGSGVLSGKKKIRKRVDVEEGAYVVLRKYLSELNHIPLDETKAFVHMDDLKMETDDPTVSILTV